MPAVNAAEPQVVAPLEATVIPVRVARSVALATDSPAPAPAPERSDRVRLRLWGGTLLGAVMGARAIPMVLLAPVSGVAADRYDRKRLIYASQGLAAAVTWVPRRTSTPSRASWTRKYRSVS